MSRSVLTATQPQVVLQSYLDDLLQEALLESDLPEPEERLVSAVEISPVVERAPQKITEVIPEEGAHQREPLSTTSSNFTPGAVVAEPFARTLTLPIVTPVELPSLLDSETDNSSPSIDLQPVEDELPAKVCVGGETPNWAGSTFECLLFGVAGVTLAVPLVCLGSIHLLNEEELTPLFGQPDWFMGIMSTPAGNLKVLETSRWLMPERYREDFREGLKYVISIQGYDWGLAVHQVSRSIRLHPDEVKWRTERSQRPWLAGTVIEHMCALLDITTMADLIASGATKNKDFLSNK